MAEKIRVILKEVDKPGVVTEIDDDIDTLQEIAGGPDRMIGMCSFPIGENIDMIYADNYLNEVGETTTGGKDIEKTITINNIKN